MVGVSDDGPLDESAASVAEPGLWDRLQQLDDVPSAAGGTTAPAPGTASGPGQSPPTNRGSEATTVFDQVGSPGPTAPPTAAGAPRQFFVPAPAPAQPAQGQQQRARNAYESVANAPSPSRSAPATTADAPSRSKGRGAGGVSGGAVAGGSFVVRLLRRLRPKLSWFRPKLRWFFLYLPLLLLLAIGGAGWWAWSTLSSLNRVDLGDSLVAPTGGAVNYLMVGSDSRDGVDPNSPDAGAMAPVAGKRSDTIIVLRVEKGKASMMSIPRDLWVTNVQTGRKGRINSTYGAGPANLVRSITATLGIPINRYVEVSFVSFAGMIDAVGGIDIEFANPVVDHNSGLHIDTAGVHHLNGSQALAFVRSRHYTETINGVQVEDPRADIGRQERQQRFIRTVLSTVGAERNPIALARVGGAAVKGVKVDSEFGVADMWSLARQLTGTTPQSVVLPTANARKGAADVLVLKEAEALPVLQSFGAGSG